MMPIRVGILGASATGGWARESHIPAILGLVGLELVAVATSRQETADAAAQAFGAKKAYGNATDLLNDPDVDLVSVCVRVPDHRALVLGAIAAGKHVYCEWPLGRTLAEAQEMAAAANAAGVHVAIGLQARRNPAALRAREAIVSGAIGRPLTVRIYSSTAGFGPKMPQEYVYLEEPANGVNMITIQGAHTLDLAIAVAGSFDDLNALATRQYPEIYVGNDASPRARSTFDHLLVLARLSDGGALSAEVAGGRPPEAPFRLEVAGDDGVLTLDGGGARGFQAGILALSLNGKALRVDDGELAAMPDTGVSVAGMYAALRDDILRGTTTAPDFQHAVRLARLVDDVMSSAQSGIRVSAADWPS